MFALIRKSLISTGSLMLIVTVLVALGATKAWADDSGQNPVKNKDSTKYDPSTRKVTVEDSTTVPGVKPGSGTKTPTGKTCTPSRNYICSVPTPKRKGPSIAEIGQQAAASITLPINAPVVGPSPSQNKWNLIPVGYPLWLWTSDTQTTISQTVSNQGLVVSVTATRQNVIFSMGDGQQVGCTSFTARPLHNDPFQQSPTCGYVYQSSGQFTVAAATTWLITWQVSGQSGSFTVTDTASATTPLPVGELHSVVVPNPPG